MPEGCVFCFTLSGLDLQTSFDNIAGGCQVSSRHTGDSTGSQKLHNTEAFGWRFSEKVGLQVGVGWEVDGGKGNCIMTPSDSHTFYRASAE